jgi:leader peptidase (prepilin peptidase)/N-methyltransferase
MLVFYTAIGLAIGSFLNLCIDRLPAGRSIIAPRSHCEHCRRVLGVVDLVPVISYLLLQGRCRSCGTSIPLRVLLVELAAGGSFAALFWWLGPGVPLLAASCFASVCILVAVIDLEHRLVLNRVIYPALLAGPLLALALGTSLADSLLGGVAGGLLLLAPYLLYRAGMGGGDVKLAAFIGLVSGFPAVILALFIAVVAGGFSSGALLLAGVRGRKDPIPFAPFLLAGGAAALLYGAPIISWYLGLL